MKTVRSPIPRATARRTVVYILYDPYRDLKNCVACSAFCDLKHRESTAAPPLSDDDESDDDDASTSSDEGSDSESDEMEPKGYTSDAEETEKRKVGKLYSRRYDTNGWNPEGVWKAVMKGDGELVAKMKISRE